MLPRPSSLPPRVLRFKEGGTSLVLHVQRTQSWMVIRGQVEKEGRGKLQEDVLLCSKDGSILAVTTTAADGSFVIETRWARKRTIHLEVGSFFVPVVKALDRPRLTGNQPARRRSDRRAFSARA